MNLDSFNLTPLAWTELYYGNDTRSIKSKQELLDYLAENPCANDWINTINTKKIHTLPERAQSLLLGYSLLDIADLCKLITYTRFKMWRLFEDLVMETYRECLIDRTECNVIRVDRLPGYRGLDFVVINDEKEDWEVGIQCKRYIGTSIPHKHYAKYGPYRRNVSTKKLIDLSEKLCEKHPGKKFVLTAFDVYYSNKQQQTRFNKLKKEGQWDKIVIFNKPEYTITKINLQSKGLKQTINWC